MSCTRVNLHRSNISRRSVSKRNVHAQAEIDHAEARSSLAWPPSSPLEAAVFLPRLTAGAILSFEEQVASVQKVLGLVTSGDPADASTQAQIKDVVEGDIARCVAKGAQVEEWVSTGIREALPDGLAEQLPLMPLAPDTPVSKAERIAIASTNSAESTAPAPAAMPTTDARSAAALIELQTAVFDVQASVDALTADGGGSKRTMLLMNVRDARDRLKLRVTEVEFSVDMGVASSALAEANALLQALDAEFGF